MLLTIKRTYYFVRLKEYSIGSNTTEHLLILQTGRHKCTTAIIHGLSTTLNYSINLLHIDVGEDKAHLS